MTKTKYRIHVILIEVVEQGDREDNDIMCEEELVGYKDDFENLEEAVKIFEAFSGVGVRAELRIP